MLFKTQFRQYEHARLSYVQRNTQQIIDLLRNAWNLPEWRIDISLRSGGKYDEMKVVVSASLWDDYCTPDALFELCNPESIYLQRTDMYFGQFFIDLPGVRATVSMYAKVEPDTLKTLHDLGKIETKTEVVTNVSVVCR